MRYRASERGEGSGYGEGRHCKPSGYTPGITGGYPADYRNHAGKDMKNPACPFCKGKGKVQDKTILSEGEQERILEYLIKGMALHFHVDTRELSCVLQGLPHLFAKLWQTGAELGNRREP